MNPEDYTPAWYGDGNTTQARMMTVLKKKLMEEELKKIAKELEASNAVSFEEGNYVNIPENLPHCYIAYAYNPGDDITGISRRVKRLPAMNALILQRANGLWDKDYGRADYIVIEDENERRIAVRITDELREANKAK